MSDRETLMFDKRLSRRFLERGELGRDAYKQHLDALPDLASEVENFATQAEDPALAHIRDDSDDA